MELQIRPEPTDEERAAIEAALEAAADGGRPAAETSRWRAAGLHEATGRDDDA